MLPLEVRATWSLAVIFALRMLGLFMIYPVFAVWARDMPGATPFAIGLALGAYGLTQALLQLPFGMLSDRWGRRPLISVGLLLFALGSVIAATSDSIDGVLIGRIVQGAGAVGSVILALGADLTREEHRTKAMAGIGMTIGLAFALALVLGPVVDRWIGVPGIFWLSAAFAGIGLLVLWMAVPQPARAPGIGGAAPLPGRLKRVIRDRALLRLDFGVLVLHAVLTASFLAVPQLLEDILGLPSDTHWTVYLPVFLASVVVMVPMIVVGERRRRMKEVALAAIAALVLAHVVFLAHPGSGIVVILALVIFFSGFNLLEATLPSLVSKAAPAEAKGTAIGIFSSAQFFGMFLGGTVGGFAHSAFGLTGLFGFTVAAGASWFAVMATMPPPPPFTSRVVRVGRVSAARAAELAARLGQVPGVAEAVVIAEEGVAYLKVDRTALDEDAMAAALAVEGAAA